jgi:hypothetical protein
LRRFWPAVSLLAVIERIVCFIFLFVVLIKGKRIPLRKRLFITLVPVKFVRNYHDGRTCFNFLIPFSNCYLVGITNFSSLAVIRCHVTFCEFIMCSCVSSDFSL